LTLYISDLDGTLMNSKEELSAQTVITINKMIDSGLKFSLATARSFNSAGRIIKPLHLNTPIILHNGVFIFDPIKQENIRANYMESETVYGIIDIFKELKITPIVFTRENNESKVYYKGIFNEGEAQFINSRLAKNDKRFTLVDNFDKYLSRNVITLIAIGNNETLKPAYEHIKEKFDLTVNYAQDIYSKAYWLELTHKYANKRDSVIQLKELIGADRVVCFGDNLNDILMFEAADEKYAVSNAHDSLKKLATGVIGSNDDDGVARYLRNEE
jgi:Cof subfamily protein (haloacid dehalogenase superfamily)